MQGHPEHVCEVALSGADKHDAQGLVTLPALADVQHACVFMCDLAWV